MWRHVSDNELMYLLSQMDRRTFQSNEMARLLWSYYTVGKFDCMRAIYARLKEIRSRDELLAALVSIGVPADLSTQCIDLSESLV